MNQLVTEAIVLGRTDYGEADRILTLLTPHYGKLSLMAKGVRRIKSKLAGGIELFSVSTITFVQGRGSVGTLVSSRLVTYYGNIVSNLDRTMLGYELIKQLNKITEDEPEEAYFDLLHHTFKVLNEVHIPLPLIRFWFNVQIIRLGGHSPNLHTDDEGHPLDASKTYNFNLEHMAFTAAAGTGRYHANHIKFLRLAFDGHPPERLMAIAGSEQLAESCAAITTDMLRNF